MIVPLRPMLMAAMAASWSVTAIAADYPSAENGMLGVMDIPSFGKPRPVPTPRGLESGAPWTITCYDYPGYRVKQLIGDGKGDLVVSVEPVRIGPKPPVCGAQDDPGEKVLSQGLFVTGARGGFVIVTGTDGPSYYFYDAISGKQVYKDDIENGKVLSFQAAGDTATMSYVRHVSGPCPLLTGGAACWQRIVREGRLPAEVARMGPPPAGCEAASRSIDPASRMPREAYNVLTYVATVTFDRSGHSTVLSRTNPGCSYDP